MEKEMSDSMILASVALANEGFKNTQRKYSGKPYVYHVLRVMGRVAAHPNVTTLEVCGAVLHDSHEDPPYIPLERIERQIHPKVAIYVGNLTSPSKKLADANGRYPQGSTRAKRVNLNCEHIHGCDYWTQTIKGYDRDDNLEELLIDLHGLHGSPSKDFIIMYCDESIQLTDALDKIEDWQREKLLGSVMLLRSAVATM